ncbi:hypothetical protein GCM10009784_06400 [Arthrobacter parietis]|uniref:Uncharacterized protein n=1 Tax=Arthrobacter parietis TaxID=271434 RepID=A0ABN3APG1_9MICC
MTDPAPVGGNEHFAKYEAALVGLLQVSGRLEQELVSARESHEAALSAAAAFVNGEMDRLDTLRRTMMTRYRTSAESIQAAKVLVPLRVRPAAGQRGDADSLSATINSQRTAEKAVALELQATVNAAKQQATDDQARIRTGQEAAEALRRRQEKLHNARQGEEAERRRAAEERTKRSRQLILGGGGAALIVLAIIAFLLIL